MEDSRPVAATVWLNVVWMRPSEAIVLIRPSTVTRSFACSRWRSMITGSSLCVWPASQARASASVVYPVLVFFVLGRASSPKRTSWSCLGEPRLNSCPAAACASFTACWTAPANICSMALPRCVRRPRPRCTATGVRAGQGGVGAPRRQRGAAAPPPPPPPPPPPAGRPPAAARPRPVPRECALSRRTEDVRPHRDPAPPTARRRYSNPHRTEPCAAGIRPRPAPDGLSSAPAWQDRRSTSHVCVNRSARWQRSRPRVTRSRTHRPWPSRNGPPPGSPPSVTPSAWPTSRWASSAPP
ncbi:hypothetical protein SALBM217S_05811 [Streptomyces griseoloalbus]